MVCACALSAVWHTGADLIARLFLLACAALLPWRLTFRLLEWLAHARSETPDAEAALAAAQGLVDIEDREAFLFRYRLYRLVDDVDLAIGLTRGSAWHKKWVHVQGGRFPTQGAFLALSFHLGAGVPALRELGRHDKGVAWIHASAENAAGSGIALRLARARIALVERVGGARTIPTGGARLKAAAWLSAQGGIVALVDAPHFGQRRVSDVRLLGKTIGLPRGLAELAQSCNAPVYLYSARLAADSGHRLLRISGPLAADETADLMQAIATFLTEEIEADPAAWHFWRFVDAGFPGAQAEGGASAGSAGLGEGRSGPST